MSEKKVQKKIDILLMSDNGLETVGGEQESTKIIINGIKDHYLLGVIQPGNISMPAEGIHYYQLTQHTRIKHLVKKPLSFIKYIWNVKRIITKDEPEIIHTQAQVSFFIVALLRKLKLISSNIQLVHTERGLYTKYSSIIKGIFHFSMKELDVLVTTTEFNMKYWKEAILDKSLSMDFKIIENTAGELFETYDYNYEKDSEDHLVIGFAGRYADWKNWPLAVEISKRLNEIIGEKVYIDMAVGCLDENAKKETINMFNELTEIFGVRFNGQINIDMKAMNEFYYGIDVFILTSNYNTESFGRTLVEAMSRKTVVFTTNAGGSVEVVGNPDKVCETAVEFVEKILEVYRDKKMLKREKELNLKRVKEKYSLGNNVSKHISLYNSLIE